MINDIHITGGADEYHAAAILTVIHHVRNQAATVSSPSNPNAQSAWLRAARQAPISRYRPPVIADPGLNWSTR